MCDSISVEVMIDDNLTDEEYELCRFPTKDPSDKDLLSADFRVQHPLSPLTGAGFLVTPLGQLAPDGSGKRLIHGRIAGYLVEVNVPACTVGHNRILVNGVPAAKRIAYRLLRWWLAQNGCTRCGLEKIPLMNARIISVTLTWLFKTSSEEEARDLLWEFRRHSETVLNKTNKKHGDGWKPPAFSYPPEPPEDGSEYTFAAYVRQREFLISAYVKPNNQPNATLIPVKDASVEATIAQHTPCMLRVEVKVHEKWLRKNELDVASAWKEKEEPYKRVFNLLRETLQLDKKVRSRRMKKTTVDSLPLTAIEKKLLNYHLNDGNVREHQYFMDMNAKTRSARYSAIKRKVEEQEGIDLDTPYRLTKLLSPRLSTLLVFPGELQPDNFLWDVDLTGHVFSRITAPKMSAELDRLTEEILQFGSKEPCVTPSGAAASNDTKPVQRYGIGAVQLQTNAGVYE